MVKKKNSIAGFITPLINRDIKMRPIVQAAAAAKIGYALKTGKPLKGDDLRGLLKLGQSLFRKEGQIGNKFISTVEVGLNSMMSESENVIVLQENESMNGAPSNRKRSTVHINEPMINSFSKLPHRHNNTSRDLINTDTDCISPKKRLLTISRCGFNQRGVDLFGQDTFVSVGNMKTLTECDYHIDKLKKEPNTIKELANIGTNRPQYKKRKTNTEINSLIKKIETSVVINSDMQQYCSRISIHVCRIRDLNCCQNPVKTLEDMYVETEKAEAKSLRKEQFVKVMNVTKEAEWEFKNSVILTVDANIRRSEVFKKDIQIVKTINRKLEPNMRFDLKIVEHYPRGVNLNKLSNIERNDLPIGTFIIVESIGDPRCVLMDSKEGGIRYNGYSPVKLRYDYFVKLHFISSESKRDVPSTKMILEPEIDFEDKELASEFYPDRESMFNVNLKNINIEGENQKARYTLGLNNEIVDQLGQINQFLRKANQDPVHEEELMYKQIKTNTTDFSELVAEQILDNVKPSSAFDDMDDEILDLD